MMLLYRHTLRFSNCSRQDPIFRTSFRILCCLIQRKRKLEHGRVIQVPFPSRNLEIKMSGRMVSDIPPLRVMLPVVSNYRRFNVANHWFC